MKRQIAALLFTLILLCLSEAWAEDLYVAQANTGAADATSCANARIYTWFNTAANWGGGAGEIDPGDTVHICGTITVAANTTIFEFQTSGTAGNVITLKFEPGAILESPRFPYGSFGTDGGAIDLKAMSHILIDGGATCGVVAGVEVPIGNCNGIIRTTDSGTNLTYTATTSGTGTLGIYSFGGSPTDVEIKNVAVSMYQRVDANDNGHAADGFYSIGILSDRAAVTDLRIHHNRVEHNARGIQIGLENVNGDDLKIYDNYMSDQTWGINIGGFGLDTFTTSVLIYGNEVTDWMEWVSPSGAYHANGIFIFHNCGDVDYRVHCYIGSPDSVIYNNYIHGDLTGEFSGASASGFIQVSSASLFTIFNNVIIGSSSVIAESIGVGNGVYLLGCAQRVPTDCGGGIGIYNNTIDYLGANGTCIGPTTETPNTMTNNIFMNGCNGISSPYTVDDTLVLSDYNIGYNLNNNVWWGGYPPFTTKTFAQWQASPYFKDLHSLYSDPLLDANYRPGTGSPAINIGLTLTSICTGQPNPGLGALCYDKDGLSRPQGSAWDVGAYEFPGRRIDLNINLRRTALDADDLPDPVTPEAYALVHY